MAAILQEAVVRGAEIPLVRLLDQPRPDRVGRDILHDSHKLVLIAHPVIILPERSRSPEYLIYLGGRITLQKCA